MKGVRDPRAGVLLPAALLLLLAGTLMAASLLVMARSAVLLADGDRHLSRAFSVREPVGEPGGEGASEIPLPEGFVLLRGDVGGVGWSVWGVGWRADPQRVAADLRAVAEVGMREGDVEGELVGQGPGEGCADLLPLDRWWVRGAASPGPDPALPPEPRLGPVGVAGVSSRSPAEPVPGGALPGPETALLVVEPGGRLEQGEGRGLLVGLGTLELGGDAAFSGLVLVGGDLVLSGNAEIHGTVRVAGELRAAAGTRILGCRSVVRDALEGVEALEAPFAVPGGRFIGRH